MDDKQRFIDILRERLTNERFVHSLRVSEEAVRLAEKYGADTEKAEFAGLLHDVMKDTPPEELLDYIQSHGVSLDKLEMSAPKLWHAIAGTLYLRHEEGVTDVDILNAVRYHTTGRAGMSLLEKVLYIADFTSADRDYNDVDIMRGLAETSLDKAARYGTTYSIKELIWKGRPIHKDTVQLYNDLVGGNLQG